MASITLDEILDISHAYNIHQGLKPSVIEGDLCVINATSVEHVDTAGVQLLVSYIKTKKKLGGDVQWQGVSQPLRSAIERLGLARELGL